MRRRLRAFAYVVSLLALGSAVWLPTSIYAQVVPNPSGGGGSGASTSADNTWTGAQTFLDNKFLVCDDGDNTKCHANQASGIATGTTRTATWPNANITVAGIDFANVFTTGQSYAANVYLRLGTDSDANNAISMQNAQTPDAAGLWTGSTANYWIVAEAADRTFDLAHPQQTNPTMFFENAAQDQTQHQGLAYYGSQGRAIKTLTETSATSVVRIPVAAAAGVGGTVTFTVFASDATDHQTLTGVLQYAAVNKAGTETCATPTLTGTALNSVSTGTLTCTYACDTTPANAVDVQFNCTSSLTQTTLDIYYRVDALGASEPLPQ